MRLSKVCGLAAILIINACSPHVSEQDSAQLPKTGKVVGPKHLSHPASRDGFVVLGKGADRFHIPALGNSCTTGIGDQYASIDFNFPEMSVKEQPCGPPYVSDRYSLVFVSDEKGLFNLEWILPPECNSTPKLGSLSAGQSATYLCSSTSEQSADYKLIMGLTSNGIQYGGRCSENIGLPVMCKFKSNLDGLGIEINFRPNPSVTAGEIVQKVVSYLASTKA